MKLVPGGAEVANAVLAVFDTFPLALAYSSRLEGSVHDYGAIAVGPHSAEGQVPLMLSFGRGLGTEQTTRDALYAAPRPEGKGYVLRFLFPFAP